MKYTGHSRDRHGFSDYMLGRTCLFPLRRFASVDRGRDGWNLYAYTRNNPINYVDPDGHFADAILDLAFLAADAGIAGYEYMTTGEVSDLTKAAIAADATMLLVPGGTGGGLMVRFAGGTAETGLALARASQATHQAARPLQVGLKGAQASQAMQMSGNGGGGGRSTGGDYDDLPQKFTSRMGSQAEKIAEGKWIDKVDRLVEKFGGKKRLWRKMKTWDEHGREIHYYEHKGIGRRGMKWEGQPDPF